jgi:hypothetical protein
MFFDRIAGLATDELRYSYLELIGSGPGPFFEEEWLDFKGWPQNEKDEKKIWSKSLSGFANITDGVIVWGIDAKKDLATNIDAACGVRLIPNAFAMESRLREWIRDATNPPVMGVEYLTVADQAGEGFIVCFVPQSAHKPHRAEWAGKQYYYRAGDDFLPAEPAMLRYLFYPRNHPILRISARLAISESPAPSGMTKLNCVAFVNNAGSATARDVYMRINIHSSASNLPQFAPANDLWTILMQHPTSVFIRANIPLHPESSVIIMSASDWILPRGAGASDVRRTFPGLEMDFHVFADDADYQLHRVRFGSTDLDARNPCEKIGECENIKR